MHSVTKTYKFDAAHRLFTMSEGHKCRNIHGHSYVVRVMIEVPDIGALENNQMVVDFSLMKKFNEYLDSFDHALILHREDPLVNILADQLCKIFIMPSNMDTTAENMAFLFAHIINNLCNTDFKIFKGIIKVEVDETVGNTATYTTEIEYCC